MTKVNRDLIIDAAIELFHRNGYHATSMRDIAQLVKIKKPSLYHHFDSKEEILRAILQLGMDTLIGELERIAHADEDPVSKLYAAVMAHASIIAENPQAAFIFLREDRGLGAEYLKEYVAKRDHFERLFRLIVEEGINKGLFRNLDVTITVQALLGMVNWMTRWYRQEGRLSAVEIAEIFFDLLLGGLILGDADQHPGLPHYSTGTA